VHKDPDLTQQETHFAFGKNWASYAAGVGDSQLEQARRGLARLLGDDLRNKRFVDVGCGSGVHALAALSLGATEVVAIDIDPDSVATTRALLETHAGGLAWSAHHASVFELDYATLGDFDVAYSWGVLHHTGDMNRAVRCAAKLVRPGGDFALALYRRTFFCDLWKAEKKWYAAADMQAQKRAERIYIEAFRAGLAVTGRSLGKYVADYQNERGMDFYHDVRDWLGGWPYESVTAQDVDRLMEPLGFARTRMFGKAGVGVGLFGVGCNEYVYKRRTGPDK
jgi:2-polyprenyl-6-hydroxyphenyl methylase/3-demethylubiquinone-9 3-methyltransferase